MNPLTAIDGAFSMHEAKRELDDLLTLLVERGGSDLHITAGIAPCFRINGELRPLEGRDRLLPVDTETLIRSVLSDALWHRFETTQELDTAYALPGVSRFRTRSAAWRSSGCRSRWRTSPTCNGVWCW
jgi:twitching motility protein PilT